MKNLKKWIILALSGVICLSMAACSNQKEEALSQKTEAEFVYVPSVGMKEQIPGRASCTGIICC